MTTLHVRNSISRSPWRGGFLLIPLVLACFALSPRAQAVTPEMLTALPDEAVLGFNTRDGLNALISLTSGQFNTGIGFAALKADNSGSHNTSVGAQALTKNTIGSYNTAIGENALIFNVDGVENMALGQGALANNLNGDNNTAMGFQALNSNNGSGNTGVGFQALVSNTSAGVGSIEGPNTAVGYQALLNNGTGNGNTAIGNSSGGPSLVANTTGRANVGIGGALTHNQGGIWNIAIGAASMLDNVSGNRNTCIGVQAGFDLTGNDNVAIGQGVFGVAGENFHTRIKNVSNTGQANFQFVTIGAGGLLGVQVSSQRYKDDIKPMDKASEALFALKPVTFRFKHEIDPDRRPQYGLIAEEVEKVNPYLVYRDEEGKIQSVRYDLVNAMMLNEFLKEHHKVQDLEATVAQQKKDMEVFAASLKEQASQVQKVSAQLEVNKPAPRTVDNK